MASLLVRRLRTASALLVVLGLGCAFTVPTSVRGAFASGSSPFSVARADGVGSPLHLLGRFGADSSSNSTPTNMTYGGGPVMPTSTTYAIFWLPTGKHFESAAGGSTGDASYESLIKRYFQDVGSSPLYNVLTQYSYSGGLLVQNGPILNQSTLGAAYVDTRAYTSGGVVVSDAGSNLHPVFDSDIQAEINRVKSLQGWTSSSTHMFFVFTGAGIESCSDSSKVECSSNAYCAYHSAFGSGSSSTIYANMPDGYSLPAADGSCGVADPNGDAYADVEISTVSHEHFEAVTDPLPESGWIDSVSASTDGGEIGDKCAYNYGPAVDPFGSDAGTANIYLEGHPYTVQQEWSNVIKACGLSLCKSTVCSATAPLEETGSAAIDGNTSDDVQYAVSYQDTSSVDQATGLTLTDSLPPGLSFNPTGTSPSPSSVNGNTLTWNISDLAPQQSGSVTIHATPTSNQASGTQLTDTASMGFSNSIGAVQPNSSISFTTTVGNGTPGPPGLVPNVGVNGGVGQITVTWGQPSDGGSPVTGYTVAYSDGITPKTQSALASARSATITGLPDATTYSVTVTATNTNGDGPPSKPLDGSTAGPPGVPQGLQVTPYDSQIRASWMPPGSDGGSPITGYTVTCDPDCGALPPTSDTSYTITGLTNGTPYTISIYATNVIGNGQPLTSDSVTPIPAPHIPQALAVTPGDSQLAASWNPPLDGPSPDGYTVSLYQSDGVTPVSGASIAPFGCDTSQTPAACTTSITGLNNGNLYVVDVSAYNGGGNGPAASQSAKPFGLPAAPTNLGASPSDGQAVITWKPGNDDGSPIDNYAVSVGAFSASVDPTTSACTATPVLCTATFTGLTDGTSYPVSVQAHNAAGDGPSATTTVIPNASPTLTPSNASPSVTYGSVLSFSITAQDSESSDLLKVRQVSGVILTSLGVKPSMALPASGTGPIVITFSGKVTALPGSYSATFAVNDGFNSDVTLVVPITVLKQTASMLPSASSTVSNPIGPVIGSGSPATSGTLGFSSTIKEVFYTSSSVSSSQVPIITPFSVTLTPVGSGPVITASGCTTTGTMYKGPSTSTLTGKCSISHVPAGVYDVHMAIVSSGPNASQYFQGSYDSVLTVYDSSWKDFGAGMITRTVNASSIKANFGFLLKPCSAGAGSNLTQAGFLYIEHRTPGYGAGDVVVSSPDSPSGASLTSCALSASSPKTATVKGTVLRSDAPGTLFNLTLSAVGGIYPRLGLAVTNGSTPTDITFVPVSLVYGSRIVTG